MQKIIIQIDESQPINQVFLTNLYSLLEAFKVENTDGSLLNVPRQYTLTKSSTQQLRIIGNYISVTIDSNFTKKYTQAELILMATQIIKAYSINNLREELEKLGLI